jgi:hypothetical protein
LLPVSPGDLAPRQTVANAMLKAAESVGVRGEVFITVPIDTGAYVSHAEPSFSQRLVKFRGDV